MKLVRCRKGSLVEASIVLPIVLLTVFGGMIGYIMYTAKQALTAAAFEAARVASVEPYDIEAARDAAARVVAAHLKVGSVESVGEATDAPPGAMQGVLRKSEDGEFFLGGVRLDPKTGALRNRLEGMVGKLIWVTGDLYEKPPEPGRQAMAVVPHPGPHDTLAGPCEMRSFAWDRSVRGMHVSVPGLESDSYLWRSWLWDRHVWPPPARTIGVLAKFVSPPVWLDKYGVYKVYANDRATEVRVNDAVTGAPGMKFDGVNVEWPAVFSIVARDRYAALAVVNIGRHWDGTYCARSLGDGWYQYEWESGNSGKVTVTAADLNGTPLEIRVIRGTWEVASGTGTVSFQYWSPGSYRPCYQIKVKSNSPYNDVRAVFTSFSFEGEDVAYKTTSETTGWKYYPIPGIEYVNRSVVPKRCVPGSKFDVNVTVKNTSEITWYRFSGNVPRVQFIYKLLGENGTMVSSNAFNLPANIRPGQQASLKLTVTVPQTTGRLKLVIEGRQDSIAGCYGIEFGADGLRWPALEAVLTVTDREKVLKVTDAGEITKKERILANVTTFDPGTDVDVQVAGDTVTATVRYRVPVLFPIFNLVGYHLSWGPEIPVTGTATLRMERPAF